MARYPYAKWRPVQGLAADPPIKPVGVILHVSGSEAPSLFGWFNGPSAGIESHFHVARNGDVEQYRDTNREADANYRGNSWETPLGRRGFLSVETQGGASGEWTAQQLAEIKRLLTWASRTHGFPLKRATGVQGTGVGYHVQFGAGASTFSWSNAKGKVCPGPDRIRQFNELLVPWMAGGASQEDDDMDQETFTRMLRVATEDPEVKRNLAAAAGSAAAGRGENRMTIAQAVVTLANKARKGDA